VLNHCSQIDDTVVDSLIQHFQIRPVRLSLSWTEITRPGLSRLRAGLPHNSVDMRPESMVGLRDVGERGQFMTNPNGEIIGFRYRREPDGWIPELQSGDLTVVSALPGMKRLSLEYMNVTDALLLEANFMPELEVLRLSSSLVSDLGMQVLERVPNLETLLIANTDLNGNGLENLRHVPKLQTLKVQTRLGNEILPWIVALNDLRALSIRAPLTDAGMEQLSELGQLRSLELVQTQVRGSGIDKLISLPRLQELAFEGGLVDDSDIEALARLKTVNQIVLAGTRVTRAGWHRLASMVPDKHVFWTEFATVPRESFR
jgi:hypothetical protein